MKQRILLLMMTVLLSVGAWAVDDISLSVVKAGMSPNWNATLTSVTGPVVAAGSLTQP